MVKVDWCRDEPQQFIYFGANDLQRDRMISIESYLTQHPGHESELTDEMKLNAQTIVDKANQLLEMFGEERGLRSGWRPQSVNDATPNSARKSAHITCQAIDLDDDDKRLQTWCSENLPNLASIGLWMENKIATPLWVHVQIIPPGSGQRVFFPNAAWARRALDEKVV